MAGTPPGLPTLGVLGGMGPAATAEFLRVLARTVPAATDQEHPRIVMLSEPAVPDRTEALISGSDAPMPLLEQSLRTLVGWGADLLAVPCNTAHVYLDRLRDWLPVPLVHIVEATLDTARAASPDGAWLTATTGTVISGIYQRHARRTDYRLLLPDDALQERVHAATTLVKANQVPAAGETFGAVARELLRREPVPLVAACTELPLAAARSGLPDDLVVSSLDALAEACVDRLYAASPTGRR
ncbi:aspartate/glutamate racemase family protein [Streptomyces sp. NRRL WC-3742]|uniref:aspartate/glutamate racemase family protein n=1 Tax=Streptomyces sp. NRRL WC-3742 TaxID=1463934 RepID=UPI000A444F0F|nr:amino acid racemase [Streptomyces sp. NRRL WC-3742]